MAKISNINLIHINGKPNPSGLGTLHGYADIEDITTLQAPTADIYADGATATTAATIAIAHVFAATKCMTKIYGTENKGKGGYTQPGEADSTTHKGAAELYHPGSKAEADAMSLRFAAWTGLVFIKEADGTVRQYGCAEFPARIKVSHDTGNLESYRGYKLEIMSYGLPFIYTPGLNFTPAE